MIISWDGETDYCVCTPSVDSLCIDFQGSLGYTSSLSDQKKPEIVAINQ